MLDKFDLIDHTNTRIQISIVKYKFTIKELQNLIPLVEDNKEATRVIQMRISDMTEAIKDLKDLLAEPEN